MATIDPSSVGNRLLIALPPEALGRLLPRLRRVEMAFRSVLLAPDKPISTVYFPETGWVSMLMTLQDGQVAEVGLVGSEGMVGLPLVFGDDRSVAESLVQGPGIALALDADVFRQAVNYVPALRSLLLRYAAAFSTQLAMTAACNVRHGLDKRLARWLLMSHDRAEGDEFAMTHEFLSTMLGVRRAGVSTAASLLQRSGLIRYEHGRVRVVDRPGLEKAACDCHRAVEREFNRLLGPYSEA